MEQVVNYAIPIIVILIMVVVGFELTIDTVLHSIKNPLILIQASVLQMVLLALICLLLTIIFSPEASIISGMVLIAACPGGALSNYYTYLAKGDVAFSVSLTTLSTLLSFITLPLFIEVGYFLLLKSEERINVPVAQLMGQLFFLLLIPVCTGMLLRYYCSEWYKKYHMLMQRMSMMGLLALLVFISWEQADYLWEKILAITFFAIVFNVVIILAGYVYSRFVNMHKKQGIAILFELPVRNLGIAAITGATLLGHTEIVVFSAAFFVIQLPVMILVILGIRKFESHLWVS